MELNDVLAWINLGLLIALWISFGRKIGLLQSDLAHGLKSISALMNSYGLFLGVLSTKKVFTAAEIQEVQKPYLEYAQGAIQREEPYKTDVGAILLVGLAAFILGFVVGSSNGATSQ